MLTLIYISVSNIILDSMAIIGYRINTIHVERKEGRRNAKININSTVSLKNVVEDKIQQPSKTSMLKISFEFASVYEPSLGEVRIEGEVYYTGKNIKNELKKWRKDKKFSSDVDAEIRNFLLRKGLVLATTLSDIVQLPPPVPMPVIRPKTKKSS